MYAELIDYISSIFLKHKAVNEVRYKKRSLINQQNNHSYIQVVIEDSGSYLQKINTKDVMTWNVNINILAFPKNEEESIKELQGVCFQVGVEVLAYIEHDETYKNLLSIYDYDFLSLSHYSDDNACGFRMSLELVVPEPISWCDFKNNFDEDVEIVEKPTLDLTKAEKTTTETIKTLTLKPMKIRK